MASSWYSANLRLSFVNEEFPLSCLFFLFFFPLVIVCVINMWFQILHYTAFLIYTRYKYESVSASLEEQKEIELSLIWIRSESHVNLNRAPRKLYLSLKPIWNKAYFKGKWSQFQSRKSLFALQYKQNREGWSPNREGCVRDKFPFLAISHACDSYSYQ